ncbi:hypothetical protein V9T40_014353 [Parthenolecanium corni]|uniref:Secreted protein n=1 Tax=Parthenolecanium corni TaxID=536013 RepID=A0AAN9T5Q7_9HEMI
MDAVINKAVIFLMAFVIVSVAHRLTGIGSQPQLACQLRNTFQMQTSVKRIGGGASLAGGSTLRTLLRFGAFETMLRKVCRKDDDTSCVNRFRMLATPLNPWFAIRRSPPNSMASESSRQPRAGHLTAFDAHDDE